VAGPLREGCRRPFKFSISNLNFHAQIESEVYWFQQLMEVNSRDFLLYYRRPVEAIQNDLGKSITAHDSRWLIDHRALRVRFTWINKRETVRDFLEVCARWIEVKLVIQLLIHKWFCWNQFSQSSIREGGKPFRIRNDGKSRPVVILVWFIRKFRQFSTSPHRVIKLDWTKSRVSNSVRTKLKKESIRI
jgi:hypothetical protein